jgi:hypothetical protein
VICGYRNQRFIPDTTGTRHSSLWGGALEVIALLPWPAQQARASDAGLAERVYELPDDCRQGGVLRL